MRIYVYQLILLLLTTIYYYFKKYNIKNNSNSIRRLKIGFLVINMGTLILISGLRGISVGTDTKAYLLLYDNSKSLSWSELFNQRVEWAYGILTKVCSLIYDDHQFYLLVFSFIIGVGFAYIIYKSSDDIPLSLFLYVTLRIYSQSMNIMRQSVAIMLIGIAYLFIKEKKWIKSTLIIILATGFHTTAIIGFLLIPLSIIKLTKSRTFILLLIEGCIIVNWNSLIFLFIRITGKYQHYLSSSYFDGSSGGRIVALIIFSFVCVGIYEICVNQYQDMEFRKISILLVASFAYVSGTIVRQNAALLERIVMYFLPFILIMIPIIIKNFDYRFKIQLKLYTYCAFGAYYLMFMFNGSMSGTIPYYFLIK